MKVWVVRYEDGSEIRLFKSKEKAYEACKEYVKEFLSYKGIDEEGCDRILSELEEEYRVFADMLGYFVSEGICWARLESVED